MPANCDVQIAGMNFQTRSILFPNPFHILQTTDMSASRKTASRWRKYPRTR
ncbi:MAG: DUF6783 domain-containing protein [Lacrimispora saccharolytica]